MLLFVKRYKISSIDEKMINQLHLNNIKYTGIATEFVKLEY